MTKFNNVVVYKVKTQKQTAFLYASNNQFKSNKKLSFTIALKI